VRPNAYSPLDAFSTAERCRLSAERLASPFSRAPSNWSCAFGDRSTSSCIRATTCCSSIAHCPDRRSRSARSLEPLAGPPQGRTGALDALSPAHAIAALSVPSARETRIDAGSALRKGALLQRVSWKSWCPGEDSNLHGFHHWYLKPARLPIPPPGHALTAKFVYGARAGSSMRGRTELWAAWACGAAGIRRPFTPRPPRTKEPRSRFGPGGFAR
jgi:hypothetical protein